MFGGNENSSGDVIDEIAIMLFSYKRPLYIYREHVSHYASSRSVDLDAHSIDRNDQRLDPSSDLYIKSLNGFDAGYHSMNKNALRHLPSYDVWWVLAIFEGCPSLVADRTAH